jgi:folate-binding protein YgfZ
MEEPTIPPPSGWQVLPRTWARITGPDAARYLNGQVSIDVQNLPEGEAAAACVCQAKGKLEAFGFVRKTGTGGFLIDADPALEPVLVPRLGKYLVADDAELSTPDPAPALIHAVGDRVAVWRRLAGENGWPSWTASRIGPAGLDVLLPEVPASWPGEAGPPVSGEWWEFFRVAQGRPAWGSELDNQTLPAEAGLDSWAVDFHKGCYVGQEVVSRMKMAGRTNRTLVTLATDPGQQGPECGAALLTEEGEPAGTITSAATHPALDLWRGLAYLNGKSSGRPRLRVAGPGSATLHVIPLP